MLEVMGSVVIFFITYLMIWGIWNELWMEYHAYKRQMKLEGRLTWVERWTSRIILWLDMKACLRFYRRHGYNMPFERAVEAYKQFIKENWK